VSRLDTVTDGPPFRVSGAFHIEVAVTTTAAGICE